MSFWCLLAIAFSISTVVMLIMTGAGLASGDLDQVIHYGSISLLLLAISAFFAGACKDST